MRGQFTALGRGFYPVRCPDSIEQSLKMCQPLSDRDVERCPAGHEPGWSNFEMAIGGRCSITLRLGGRYALLFLGRRNRLGRPRFRPLRRDRFQTGWRTECRRRCRFQCISGLPAGTGGSIRYLDDPNPHSYGVKVARSSDFDDLTASTAPGGNQ